MSCRVRLARNLTERSFPDWNDETGHFQVLDTILGALRMLDDEAPQVIFGDRKHPGNPEELTLLYEQHLISRELFERGRGGALIRCHDADTTIMINEEDHLRIQVIRSGLDLEKAWMLANRLDSQLDQHLEYAFSPQLGYLTACPSNVGTALRASVMVHLLGLRLADDLDPVLRSLTALRLMVRGVYGEGSDAAGHLFQISNQGTLGQQEDEVIGTLIKQVSEVIRQEELARQRLLREKPALLHDCIARALALLQNARLLASDEAMDYLSALRLGVQLKLLKNLTLARVDELCVTVQPAHLQRMLHLENATPEVRDQHRASWLQRELKPVIFDPESHT